MNSATPLQYAFYPSPLGKLLLAFDGRHLCHLSLDAAKGGPFWSPWKETTLPLPLRKQLDHYFSGRSKSLDYPLDFLSGTPFEQKVWKVLRTIPYGEVKSYQWVAERAGSPLAVRAVGQANRKNPLPIFVPCHRVI